MMLFMNSPLCNVIGTWSLGSLILTFLLPNSGCQKEHDFYICGNKHLSPLIHLHLSEHLSTCLLELLKQVPSIKPFPMQNTLLWNESHSPLLKLTRFPINKADHDISVLMMFLREFVIVMYLCQ